MEGKRYVEVLCHNAGCRKPILFEKNANGVPEKTYCDLCCGEMSTPPTSTEEAPKLEIHGARNGLPVFCYDCGYKWRTTTDEPHCPKCKSQDIGEID